MNRTPTLLIFSTVTIAIWFGVLGLSSYSATDLLRKEQQKELPAQNKLAELQAALQKHPEDHRIKFQVAKLLLKSKEGKDIVQAVKYLTEITHKDKSNSEATLELARIFLQLGQTNAPQMLDMGYELYDKYLALKPRDLDVKSEYGLALAQNGVEEKSEKVLREVLNADPKSFKASFGLALALQIQGRNKEAKKFGTQALNLAPDKETRHTMLQFLGMAPIDSRLDSQNLAFDESSPALAIKQFFQSHPIIGPKMSSLRWVGADKVQIYLMDFPADKMPAAAKAKFKERIQRVFARSEQKITIELLEKGFSKPFMSITVGGTENTGSKQMGEIVSPETA